MPKDIETKIREIFEDYQVTYRNGIPERCEVIRYENVPSIIKALVSLLTPDVDEKDTIRMIIDRIEMWADDGLIKTTEDIVKRLESIDSSLKPSNKPDVEELKKEFEKKFFLKDGSDGNEYLHQDNMSGGTFTWDIADTDSIWNFFLPYLKPSEKEGSK